MKYLERKVVVLAAVTVAMLSAAAPAAAAPDVFSIVRNWTSNMPAIKDGLIYFFFLAGLVGIGWGGLDMYKKSKERGGEDVKWSGIAIKFLAGVILISLTLSSDTMKSTVFGSSASSSTTNLQ